MPILLYTADVVCPMTGPPLEGAGVLVRDDTVVAVGDADTLAEDADRVRHTAGVLLPGLVNAHTSLEHADAGELARSGPHHAWVPALAGMTSGWDDRRWKRSAHRGVQALLRSGATTVGDVVRRGPAVPASARAGLRGTSWIGIAEVDRDEQDPVIAALERSLGLPAPGRTIGIAPVAPHLVGAGVMQALSALAVREGVPLHIPTARSQAEVVALWSAEGPEADRVRSLGLGMEWLDGGTGLSPVRYLAQLGALERGTTLAHGVWVEENEAALLARLGVGIVCTPRADELLQVGQAPLERFAQAGVAIALGTDTPAASPDLDILAEATAWARAARDRGLYFWPSSVGPIPLEEAAIRLVTIEGARTMGWGGQAGILEPGRRADFVVVDVASTAGTVYRDLVEAGPGRQVLTVVGGVRKTRRGGADEPWPSIDHELEEPT
jgi:aminodeoxyfutalosine deaminase